MYIFGQNRIITCKFYDFSRISKIYILNLFFYFYSDYFCLTQLEADYDKIIEENKLIPQSVKEKLPVILFNTWPELAKKILNIAKTIRTQSIKDFFTKYGEFIANTTGKFLFHC